MQAPTPTTLTAANDNPDGSTETALIGLITLLARAEMRRAANINAAPTASAQTVANQTKKALQ